MKIQQTTNYGMFTDHPSQQPMSTAHVKKLIGSMKRNGFIKAKPIHVCQGDGTLLIVDGHHRLAAAKALKIPVSYIVGNQEDSELIADSNFAVRKWTALSFIKMYAQRGNPDYKKLLGYIYRGVSHNLAVSLLSGSNMAGSGANHLEHVQRGTWKIRTTETIDTILAFIDEAAKVAPAIKSERIMECIAVLMSIPQFCLSTLSHKIAMNPRLVVKVNNRAQALAMIEEIFNFAARSKRPLAFLAEEAIKHRAKTFGGK